MTNNPTIDGVSREDLQTMIDLSIQGFAGDWVYARNKLRSLLDAPAVERQEAGYVLAKQTAVEVPGQERKELGYTLFDGIGVFRSREEVHAAIAELGLPIGWVSMTVDQLLPGYMMTDSEASELAALQSSIARLEAQLNNAINLDFQRRERITQLESEAMYAAAGYQAARDRLAELEADKGRGEPVAVMYADGSVLTKAECGTAFAICCKVETPLFTAPPAPGAVVLPPFAEKVISKLRRCEECFSDFESCGVDIGRHWLDLLTQLGLLNRVQRSPAMWEITQQGEDCLDATAALNGPKS